MNILGIETSCDETAAAVVRQGKGILSNIVTSSLKEHKKFGGIIPEIASRRQLEFINPVVRQALQKARIKLSKVDAIAVTKSPGLIGSLLVGTSFAQSLSFVLEKPLIEIDHIQAHVYANFLSAGKAPQPKIKLPAVGLVVSGGHTSLYHIKNVKDFRLIGQTRDDAAGEAFDKVARILGLGYPGGPAIDRLAKTIKKPNIAFTCARLADTLDFSFSGIKTAVLYYHRKHEHDKDYSVAEVACAFQKSVVHVLIEKCLEACRQFRLKTLLIGGGVAANSYLRSQLSTEAQKEKIAVYFPPINLCLDNAAMIAGLGYHFLKKKRG